MHKINITQISNAHNRWLRSMEFYKQEIDILKKILSEIAAKNSSAPVVKEVALFERQFKELINNIDRLSADIRENIVRISKQAQTATAGFIDSTLLAHHSRLEEKFESEEIVINELRAAFHHFALEWM